MTYKDEYEVARLYSTQAFRDKIAAEFDGSPRLSLNLAPPFVSARRDERTGRPAKRTYGAWIFPGAGAAEQTSRVARHRARPVRAHDRAQAGAALDRDLPAGPEPPGGGTHARKSRPGTVDRGWPDAVRGFGPVKEEGAARALSERESAWTAFAGERSMSVIAAGDSARKAA